MKKETIEALQKAGQLLAEQEYGQPQGVPVEMHFCNPCEHQWDFSEPEVLRCQKCGFTEYISDDDYDDDDECRCGAVGCAECDARYYDDFDCGMGADGQCGKAGSEECDWECPFGK